MVAKIWRNLRKYWGEMERTTVVKHKIRWKIWCPGKNVEPPHVESLHVTWKYKKTADREGFNSASEVTCDQAYK